MKVKVKNKSHGDEIKRKIIESFRENGFISAREVKQIIVKTTATSIAIFDDESIFGWDEKSDLDKKMRVRELKSGCFVYMPEPNAIVSWRFPKIEDFERLVDAIIDGFQHLANQEQIKKAIVLPTVPCTVKAKKSGPKAVRVDRPARFHRWVHSTKGVEQELALVHFPDGHIEYVQPTNIIFPEEVE